MLIITINFNGNETAKTILDHKDFYESYHGKQFKICIDRRAVHYIEVEK